MRSVLGGSYTVRNFRYVVGQKLKIKKTQKRRSFSLFLKHYNYDQNAARDKSVSKYTFLQRLYLLKSVVKYPNHLVRLL